MRKILLQRADFGRKNPSFHEGVWVEKTNITKFKETWEGSLPIMNIENLLDGDVSPHCERHC